MILEKEQLLKNELSLDGNLFMQETGFSYKFPQLTIEELTTSLNLLVENNMFPNIF